VLSVGRRAWWLPIRLGRLVPNLDIEGEKLAHGLGKTPASA
jgi:RND superfamily putative drug exporter